MCPVGCSLKVEKKGNEIVVIGNSCPRGEIYGKKEVTSPERIVTSVIRGKNFTCSVKSDNPVPKNLVDEVLKEIKKVVLKNPPSMSQIVIKNVLNTNSNIIVTGVHLL